MNDVDPAFHALLASVVAGFPIVFRFGFSLTGSCCSSRDRRLHTPCYKVCGWEDVGVAGEQAGVGTTLTVGEVFEIQRPIVVVPARQYHMHQEMVS